MSAGRGLCLISAIGALAALSTAGDDARACGGCFTGGGESTIVTAHRMALSVSTDRTVLWDQIRYQGDPEEFAWVLPVKPGATIELASDAFFEALDAATTTSVNRPPSAVCTPPPYEYDDGYYAEEPGDDYAYMGCAVSGCSAGGERGEALGGGGRAGGGSWATVTTTTSEPPPPVEVVHEESIGPYEAVVLSSNEPGALYDWLLSHGYGVDPSMERMIDGYEAEGFDFVGLRLIPGAGTRQMKPVRVITPGASPVLPLRMVAAGTGANVALTLFMIGEGRWEAQSFPNAVVPTSQIDWDLAASSSTYGELRLAALAQNEGATWLTTYAKQGSLLSPVYNNVSMSSSVYLTTDGYGMSTIASLYAQQGVANGEFVDLACLQAFNTHATSGSKVVDPCAPPAGNDGGGGAGSAGAGGSGAGGGAGGAGAGGAGAGGAMAVGGSGGAGGAGEGGVNAGGSTGVGGSGGAGGAGVGGAAQGAGGAMSGAGGSMAVGGAGGGEPEEPTCLGPAGPGMIDARQLVCGDLDDISVALVGMRPASVWLTRMEANLPRAALAQDLALQAAPDQSPIENWLFAATYTGDPCLASDVVRLPPKKTSPRRPPFGGGDLLAIAATLATFLFAAARRQLRAATRKPAAARWSA